MHMCGRTAEHYSIPPLAESHDRIALGRTFPPRALARFLVVGSPPGLTYPLHIFIVLHQLGMNFERERIEHRLV